MNEDDETRVQGPSNPVERREDRRFGKRYILRNIALAIPPSIALCVLWFSRNEAGSTTWIATASFVVWMVGWVLADVVWFRRYRCPSCGSPIRSATITRRQAGDPIIYFCRECNVEWDTRLRESRE
jgi:predicted RNA-binding Zn-ribbon protein involved in translation (DUF1610 family)